MKKLIPAILLLFVILNSCSQKKTSASADDALERAQIIKNQEFIFNKLLENKVPLFFKNLMLAKVYRRNTSSYVFEELYPDCMGIMDSSGFYSGECDDGKWLDSLLFEMEEARMGDDLFKLLEDDSLNSSPIVEEPEAEEGESEESSQKVLLDSGSRLKIMEFGKELFVPSLKAGQKVMVHYSDKKAIRLFYDESFRLIKKELWQMDSVADAKITGEELFEYEGDSKNPDVKIIQNESYKIVSKFDFDGLVIEAKKYKALENKSFEYESEPVSKSSWEYDSRQRVILEIIEEYTYKEQKASYINEKKSKFIYNEDKEVYEYYENGSLKIKTEYETKGTYKNTLFFDEKDSVTTYYENYIKQKDVYMSNGVETRVKTYE